MRGIDEPHLWHGNTLTQDETYGGLFESVGTLYDVVLTNPPFDGKEGKEAQTHFAYKTGATQVLFLQHVIDSLKAGGRCGIVLDEGALFCTNEQAFVQTKRKLLEEYDLWCIVSLPGGVFTAAAKVSKQTCSSSPEANRQKRLVLQPVRSEGQQRANPAAAKNYDLKTVNPNARNETDGRTPDELLDLIETKSREIQEALVTLRQSVR